MRRSPFVLAGTALGLGVVLSVHTTSSSSSALASTTTASGGSKAATTKRASAAMSTTSTARSTATSTAASHTASSARRTATGSDISYQYGDLELKVTAKGTKIVNVSVVRLDVTDPRSQQIDEYAIPQLDKEVLAAHSAKIDAISGASYTSQAYLQSLQSALDRLGITSASS